jgi:hypothetical protein
MLRKSSDKSPVSGVRAKTLVLELCVVVLLSLLTGCTEGPINITSQCSGGGGTRQCTVTNEGSERLASFKIEYEAFDDRARSLGLTTVDVNGLAVGASQRFTLRTSPRTVRVALRRTFR